MHALSAIPTSTRAFASSLPVVLIPIGNQRPHFPYYPRCVQRSGAEPRTLARSREDASCARTDNCHDMMSVVFSVARVRPTLTRLWLATPVNSARPDSRLPVRSWTGKYPVGAAASPARRVASVPLCVGYRTRSSDCLPWRTGL